VLRIGLAVALLTAPATIHAAERAETAQENSEGWTVKSAWVTVLPRKEQTVVLLLLRSALNTNLITHVMPNARKNPADMEWMIKTQFVGNYELSRLATNSPDVRGPMSKCAHDLGLVIDGKMPLADYQSSSVQTTQALARVLSEIDLVEAENTGRKYKRRIEETATHLIGFAKLAASQGPKGKLR
jgi:hypothetical protein